MWAAADVLTELDALSDAIDRRSAETRDRLPIPGNVGAVLTDDDVRRLRDDIQR